MRLNRRTFMGLGLANIGALALPRRATAAGSSWDASAFRTSIQETLDAFVDEQRTRLAPLGDDAARLVREARMSVAGGKRFRAAFCY